MITITVSEFEFELESEQYVLTVKEVVDHEGLITFTGECVPALRKQSVLCTNEACNHFTTACKFCYGYHLIERLLVQAVGFDIDILNEDFLRMIENVLTIIHTEQLVTKINNGDPEMFSDEE